MLLWCFAEYHDIFDVDEGKVPSDDGEDDIHSVWDRYRRIAKYESNPINRHIPCCKVKAVSFLSLSSILIIHYPLFALNVESTVALLSKSVHEIKSESSLVVPLSLQ